MANAKQTSEDMMFFSPHADLTVHLNDKDKSTINFERGHYCAKSSAEYEVIKKLRKFGIRFFDQETWAEQGLKEIDVSKKDAVQKIIHDGKVELSKAKDSIKRRDLEIENLKKKLENKK